MDDMSYRGYAALRRGRVSLSGHVYLVTTVTRSRAPIFSDFRAARAVVAALRRECCVAQTLCYVVMPDHMHWLFSLGAKTSLSQLVGRVKGRCSYQIGRLAGVRGIWQAGFHDHALRREEELLPTARYVIANPIRAGLLERVGDYPLWDAVWLDSGFAGIGNG